MKIICQFGDDTELARLWAEHLQQALPGATVNVWERGMAAADFAIVWQPSAELFEQQPGLKAVFNAGAGVDAFRHINLSGNVPVFRLEDAGMAEQMSDYVCQAVLHHFREMDSYARQAVTQVWKSLAPRRKDDFPVGILGFGIMGKAVAHSLCHLGFRVNAWTRTGQTQQGVTCYVGDEQLEDFLVASRMVVCLLPLTPATRGILCAKISLTCRRVLTLSMLAEEGICRKMICLPLWITGRLQEQLWMFFSRSHYRQSIRSGSILKSWLLHTLPQRR